MPLKRKARDSSMHYLQFALKEDAIKNEKRDEANDLKTKLNINLR